MGGGSSASHAFARGRLSATTSDGSVSQLLTANYLTDWLFKLGRLNCYWPSRAQSFLATVCSRSMTKIFVSSQACMCVYKWGLLFDERGVSLFMQALRLLYRSFSTSIFALSRRPGHYGLCVPLITALYEVTFIHDIQRVSVNADLCSRLCFNLCNYSETAVSQLNGRKHDRRE
jgi:hypothetical protein